MNLPSELDVAELIKSSCDDLSEEQAARWARLYCTPQLWSLRTDNLSYGPFWVVGILEQECVYYNHIEGGYDISEFNENGVINRFGASQYELNHVVEILT